ncbi:hypothetical protein AKJ16_DCAP00205, partial [Drosera capensis]
MRFSIADTQPPEQQLDAVVDRRGVPVAAITSIVAANLCQISSLQFPVFQARHPLNIENHRVCGYARSSYSVDSITGRFMEVGHRQYMYTLSLENVILIRQTNKK